MHSSCATEKKLAHRPHSTHVWFYRVWKLKRCETNWYLVTRNVLNWKFQNKRISRHNLLDFVKSMVVDGGGGGARQLLVKIYTILVTKTINMHLHWECVCVRYNLSKRQNRYKCKLFVDWFICNHDLHFVENCSVWWPTLTIYFETWISVHHFIYFEIHTFFYPFMYGFGIFLECHE